MKRNDGSKLYQFDAWDFVLTDTEQMRMNVLLKPISETDKDRPVKRCVLREIIYH